MRRNGTPKLADDAVVETAPTVIQITAEGRRLVDPMSIIGSATAMRHLQALAKARLSHPDPSEADPK